MNCSRFRVEEVENSYEKKDMDLYGHCRMMELPPAGPKLPLLLTYIPSLCKLYGTCADSVRAGGTHHSTNTKKNIEGSALASM